MERLASGDRAAFEPLFLELYPRAVALARRRLVEADAEDAAQRTMTALFARASEYTKGRPVLPWFYAIAANETHAIARRASTALARSAPSDAAERVAAGSDPERELADAELRAELRAAIATLDPASAAAIRAHLGDASTEGGAHQDDSVSPAALRKRVSRAYARLRLALGGRA